MRAESKQINFVMKKCLYEQYFGRSRKVSQWTQYTPIVQKINTLKGGYKKLKKFFKKDDETLITTR